MKIGQMFQKEIKPDFNGVIQVQDEDTRTLVTELDEYVITTELKRHFMAFFNSLCASYDHPTTNVGVWISGFFGSGKSHFLKMLSYILENREVAGVKTVERFRSKFADDPATFMMIDRATRTQNDTILFNIDREGSINKDRTAVLRVFFKMFYNHLGFYGENLKVAKLEQHVARQGKTEEFRRVFKEKNGAEWVETRDAYAFFEDDIVDTLREVLGMSEQAARNWFNGSENVDTSIAQLAEEVKAYVDTKPKDYRLFFMVDEVGQYVGADLDLLLNLQSIVETLGSKCQGKVWIACTGQEALDEIIKARENEFSKIKDRFPTRLSLSSSAADEVIQKRLLSKNAPANTELDRIYSAKAADMKNLFHFEGAMSDLKGYAGALEFARDFPFVPYQYTLMQRIYTEVRRHGIVGASSSNAARSMLGGFHDAAMSVLEKDEYTLVPLDVFYDSLSKDLSNLIRDVVSRCQKAANNGDGIEPFDVRVLKLLFLIRYVDNEIKSNLENIVILMADDIRMDKIEMRKTVQASLDRLYSQNYIGKSGDTWHFLTDEEQDILIAIKSTPVSTADIVSKIATLIFGDIYTAKKFHQGRYDFPFDQMVDGQMVGSMTGGMTLKMLTVAADDSEKSKLYLLSQSSGQVIAVLAENTYYDSLEYALKIRKEMLFLSGGNRYYVSKKIFYMIPDYPFAYWTHENAIKAFQNRKELSEVAEIVSGMTTGNNDLYLRLWWEVRRPNMALGYSHIDQVDLSRQNWFPYNKGGAYRRWYGNNEYLVNWSQSGNFNRAKTTMTHLYLRKCLTWADISTNDFAARACEVGFFFDVQGSCAFPDNDTYWPLLALLNTKIMTYFTNVLNPTMHTQVGDIKRVPFVLPDNVDYINQIAKENVSFAKADWDSFETSWEFPRHPLLPIFADNPNESSTIELWYHMWERQCENRFQTLKKNEEKLNRIFIDIYGLQDELMPDIEDKDVTVRKADLQRDVRSLLSYAVGCMLGRYSLNCPALVYAGGTWDASKYTAFQPDEDAILPICDDEYFEDDIVGRLVKFVETVYGKDTLEENLRFIADALGGKGSSREVILFFHKSHRCRFVYSHGRNLSGLSGK